MSAFKDSRKCVVSFLLVFSAGTHVFHLCWVMHAAKCKSHTSSTSHSRVLFKWSTILTTGKTMVAIKIEFTVQVRKICWSSAFEQMQYYYCPRNQWNFKRQWMLQGRPSDFNNNDYFYHQAWKKGSARQTSGLPNTTANQDVNLSNITCCFRMYNSRGTWRSHFAPCTGVKNWTEEGHIKLWVRCWFGVFRWQPQCSCYIYSRQTSVAQERWTGHKYYESKIPHEQQKYKEALLKHGHYFVLLAVVYHMKMILYKIYWKMILGLVMHWSSPFQCLANCTTNSKRLPLPSPLMSVFQATVCHKDCYVWFLKN